MSFAEPAADTEAQQILTELAATQEKVQELINAVNGLGLNVQWIVDNAKGIFEMFSNPAFMSMIPSMLGGNPGGGQPADE